MTTFAVDAAADAAIDTLLSTVGAGNGAGAGFGYGDRMDTACFKTVNDTNYAYVLGSAPASASAFTSALGMRLRLRLRLLLPLKLQKLKRTLTMMALPIIQMLLHSLHRCVRKGRQNTARLHVFRSRRASHVG